MQYSIGQNVQHPAKREWGVGQVVDLPGDGKVHVDFPNGGLKKLLLAGLVLEIVARPGGRLDLDLDHIFLLCDQFRSEMGSNRSNTNDGGMALKIKSDLLKNGRLTAATKKTLLEWCHTGGSFVRAEAIAHQICTGLYGSVLRRVD